MATPLTKTDISNCQAGMYECAELEKEIERAQACGLDCQEAELRNKHLQEFYRKVLENYSSLFTPAPH